MKPPPFLLKNHLVVKREVRPSLQGKRSRVTHEKEILMRIKNGMSLFLSKYYLNIEKTNEENELMMDYIKYPSLSAFMQDHRETISYQTKICLAYMIAQALRFLQDYQITHLDLKPSNIMLSTKMLVKIIDFGESHHPDFTSKAWLM